LIDPVVCSEQLGAKGFKLVDCRFSLADTDWGRNEHRKGHIPGAVYAHLDEDLSGKISPGITGRHPLPDPQVFIKKLEGWGINKNDRVVVYDQSHGGLAARFWWMLRWIGHDKTVVLDGGWAEWSKMNLPVSTEIPEIEVSSFEGEANPQMVIEMKEIANWIEEPSKTIVDARAHVRYTGEKEPIDPVAGHIPSALSLPFLENISESGRWKSAENLRQRFAEYITGRSDQTAVYCGSGVTACHNILALELAGYPGTRLYPGSWSEWVISGENAVKIGVEELRN